MNVTLYQTLYGIYSPNCGFDNLIMSWGHNEYLYQVMTDCLAKEALYIIRFHSFYPAHREGAYQHFMNEFDKEMLPGLKLFSHYDLFSKDDERYRGFASVLSRTREEVHSHRTQLVIPFMFLKAY